jgi:hypothetical protein
MPIVTMPNGDRVQFPDDMSKDQIKEKIRSKFPEDVDSGWQLAGDELKGAARGVGKGLGKLAEELPTLGVPHVGELDPNAKQFLDSPNATYGEAIGTFAGENAPAFAVGQPEVGLIKAAAPRMAPYLGRAAADALSTALSHVIVGGATGAAQPVNPGESRLVNALGGAATGGLLSPQIAGKIGGMAVGAGAGLGFEQLVRQFGWTPVLAALGSLGVGAGHFGLGGLARRATRLGQAPAQAVSKVVPATVKGAVGGRATESAQETYDANQPGPAQRQ